VTSSAAELARLVNKTVVTGIEDNLRSHASFVVMLSYRRGIEWNECEHICPESLQQCGRDMHRERTGHIPLLLCVSSNHVFLFRKLQSMAYLGGC
jgi:hypothetical protein